MCSHLKLGLGLEHRLLDKVGLFSGGQRQALTMLTATTVRLEVLLFDRHAAALDPKTAGRILQLPRDIVAQQRLTTLMITHNRKHAITFGNRLIMRHQGLVILDLSGKTRQALTVSDLPAQFSRFQGEELGFDPLQLS